MGASHPEKNRTFGGLLCCALYKSMAADIHLNLLINLLYQIIKRIQQRTKLRSLEWIRRFSSNDIDCQILTLSRCLNNYQLKVGN